MRITLLLSVTLLGFYGAVAQASKYQEFAEDYLISLAQGGKSTLQFHPSVKEWKEIGRSLGVAENSNSYKTDNDEIFEAKSRQLIARILKRAKKIGILWEDYEVIKVNTIVQQLAVKQADGQESEITTLEVLFHSNGKKYKLLLGGVFPVNDKLVVQGSEVVKSK